MKIKNITVLYLCFAALGLATVRGQTTKQIADLESIIKTDSLAQLSNRLQSADSPGWPRISTDYEVGKLPANQQAGPLAALQLSQTFLSKLNDSFDRSAKPDGAALSQEVSQYFSLSRVIRNAGGYSNLVLADTLDQLAFYRLSDAVIRHPDKATEYNKILQSRSLKPLEIKSTLHDLASQDSALEKQKDKIGQIQNDENFVSLSITFDGTGNPGIDPINGGLASSALLKDQSALALVIRLGTTDALMNALLPGLIDFLQQGGSISDLNPQDNRAFKQRMGSHIFVYKAPFLGMKFLSATRLRAIVDMQGEIQNQQHFLDIALK